MFKADWEMRDPKIWGAEEGEGSTPLGNATLRHMIYQAFSDSFSGSFLQLFSWSILTDILPRIFHLNFRKLFLDMAFPQKGNISAIEHCAAGGANTNFRITVDGAPYILRLYKRDPKAADREQSIGKLLKDTVPVPQTLYKGTFDGQTFAIMSHLPGRLCRGVLLDEAVSASEKEQIFEELGQMLALLSQITFDKAGFFDDTLQPQPHPLSYMNFLDEMLSSPKVIAHLDDETRKNIRAFFDKHHEALPDESKPVLVHEALLDESKPVLVHEALLDESKPVLVHGDCDPSNILLINEKGQWKVSGLLDFEFAFAGSYLWDVSNMLRYRRKIPMSYTDAFIHGLERGGLTLPSNWETTTSLLTLSSLLDILHRYPQKKRPRQSADIYDLIKECLH